MKYHRTNIVGLSPEDLRRAYISEGAMRWVSTLAYHAIVAACVAGTVVCLYTMPGTFIAGFVFAYVLENSLMFPTIHTLYHAMFIELKEGAMTPGQHYAFVHHYRDTRLFPKIWLDYRLQYLWNRDNLSAWTNFVLLYGILAATALLAFASPLHALCFFTCFAVNSLLQGVVHEWYHCPRSRRQSFYSLPVYGGLTLLETVGLIDTARHVDHHRHSLESLDQVEQWVDCRSPFAEAFCERLWREALKRHVPGGTKMVAFLARIAVPAVALRFIVLVGLFAYLAA